MLNELKYQYYKLFPCEKLFILLYIIIPHTLKVLVYMSVTIFQQDFIVMLSVVDTFLYRMQCWF